MSKFMLYFDSTNTDTMERITKIIFQIFAFLVVFLYANAGELLIMLMALYFPLMFVCVKIDRLMLKYS